MSKEVWKPVDGYDGLYEVSSRGRVRSLDHYSTSRNRWGIIQKFFAGRILSCEPNKGTGYRMVMLCDGRGGRRQCLVHLLVATAFHGPCQAGQIARHRNGVKADCRKANLLWGTPKENSEDAVKHGHQVRGERQGSAKFTEAEIAEIKALRGKMFQKDIAARFGTSRQYIGAIQRGKSWAHVQ